MNFRGSVEARLSLKVSYSLLSNRFASRARASIRKCFPHFGQTFRFSSRSFFQMIWRQLSHFTHNPSVRIFFSPEGSTSPDCRLNQAMELGHCIIAELNHWKLLELPAARRQ